MAADGFSQASNPPTDLRASFVGRFIDGAERLYRTRHHQLFHYWSERRPSPGLLPGRRHIDPCDIPVLLKNIWMTDVVETADGLRFRERLVGTGLVDLFGIETTGRWFEDIYEGEHLARQLTTYTAIATAGQPHLSRIGVPLKQREFLIYDRLILPLASDGLRPDILLGIHAYEPEPDEEPARWPAPDLDYGGWCGVADLWKA